MRTRRILFTLLAAILASFATASEKPQWNVQSLGNDRILVTIQSPQESEIEVQLIDKHGDIVFYEQSGKSISRYHKIFDFSYVDNGDYEIKVVVNGSASEREMVVASDRISIGNPIDFVKPFFAFDGEKLLVSHLNFENENYLIEIHDDQGVVYQAHLESTSPIHAGFDLSKLEAGSFQVYMNSKFYDYSFTFEKREYQVISASADLNGEK